MTEKLTNICLTTAVASGNHAKTLKNSIFNLEAAGRLKNIHFKIPFLRDFFMNMNICHKINPLAKRLSSYPFLQCPVQWDGFGWKPMGTATIQTTGNSNPKE